MVDIFMNMPALDTEIVSGDRMASTRAHTGNPAMFHVQIQTASTAAVTADTWYIRHTRSLEFEYTPSAWSFFVPTSIF